MIWDSWLLAVAGLRTPVGLGLGLAILRSFDCNPHSTLWIQVQNLVEFNRLIRRWESCGDRQGPLFSPASLISAVQSQIKIVEQNSLDDSATQQEKLELLRDALGELYKCARQYVQALHVMLQQGKGEVWQLITEHGLFGAVQDHVLMLMRFDAKRAISLLVRHTDDVPVTLVVQQLQSEPELLHQYLHQLFLFDESKGAEFHDLQVNDLVDESASTC